MTSSMAVAGAVMGAVLALFLIIIFTIVLVTARKVPQHTHTDKVIDLPPTHRPPPPYSERPLAVPQDPHTVAFFSQPQRMDKCQVDRTSGRMTHPQLQNPSHHPLSYQEWICHQNGAILFTSTTESIMSDASANDSQCHNVYPTSEQFCGITVCFNACCNAK
ncbi:hypothetical protein PHYPO_G00062820 [Pangasianodon hypophthalmus]|uniref:Uncharacterized protein n=1 Tax=Pangasianodon hypophthalmus TaxID=310915 RepID=A0A5N5M3T4_PANHP|nr:hypothetical protein PHYPO_G00062820 [Pangasianodon hypophthalmus]